MHRMFETCSYGSVDAYTTLKKAVEQMIVEAGVNVWGRDSEVTLQIRSYGA